MQTILVNIIAVAAFLFIARSFYRAFAIKRRDKAQACSGCGTCEAARKDSEAAAGANPASTAPVGSASRSL